MLSKKGFFASMLATMFFFLFTFNAGATDPVKIKTDPVKTDPGGTGMTIPIASLEELAQYVSDNSSSVLALSGGAVLITSIPIIKERSNLKTEVLVQKLNGTLELIQIKTQTRNDGVVENQTMFIYPTNQDKNYIQGNNPTPVNNPYNAVVELNSLFSAKKHQSLQSTETGLTKPKQQTSRSGAGKTQR